MNHTLLLLINGWAGKNHLLDTAMVFCASYLIYLVFAGVAACIIYLAYKKEWRSIIYFLAALATTFIVLKFVGILNFDHRPFMDYHLTQLVEHASGKSFPSDHTTASAGIAFGLLFFTRFKKTGAILVLVAALIGFSRIFVGIHYPFDILGGLVAGLVGAGIVYGVKKIVDARAKPLAE